MYHHHRIKPSNIRQNDGYDECQQCKKCIKTGIESNHSKRNIINNKNKKISSGDAFLCDTSSVDNKQERFSFRELAKNLFFFTEHDDEFKYGYGYGFDPINNEICKDSIDKYLSFNKPSVNVYKDSSKHIFENTRNSDDKFLKANKTIINESKINFNEHEERNPEFKIVAITDIPKKISISSLLNEIYGGPLEKIELVRKDNFQFYNDEKLYKLNHPINWDKVSIFLHFNKYEDAKKFYQYSKTGIFRINDVYLNTIWIPKIDENIEDSNNIKKNLLISKLMKSEEKARRVLVLKKPLLYDKKRNYKVNRRENLYSNAILNYSEDFNVEEIKKDFEAYGKLIEILPVVSRKLCFGIQYYDVRSAIKVKRIIQSSNNKSETNEFNNKTIDDGEFDELNEQDLQMRNKYQDWHVWYGKDPADKSVPIA
jgi:hypothetical protein